MSSLYGRWFTTRQSCCCRDPGGAGNGEPTAMLDSLLMHMRSTRNQDASRSNMECSRVKA